MKKERKRKKKGLNPCCLFHCDKKMKNTIQTGKQGKQTE